MMSAPSSESPPDILEDGQDDGHEDGQEDASGPPAKRQKRSRACQACRQMKIRCNPVEGQEACKACSKVNRECIMPGPARKRQKTVHKVAELEKKIDALTASLIAKNKAATAPTPPNDSPATTSTPSTKKPDKEYGMDSVINKQFDAPTADFPRREASLQPESVSDDYEDVIARGIVDHVTAAATFRHWKTAMCVTQPIVVFSDRVDVEWLRSNRPMTLLAILVVASGPLMPIQQADLAVEISRQLADRVMFYNEKSLDLVHAMLIYTSWYGKHKFAKDLGFNHYIHSAVAMCLDLGYGKRSRTTIHSDPEEDAEVRRTWMGCYFMSSSVASVLRLPPLVTWSPYIEECLEVIMQNPVRAPTDGFLCAMVKIHHIVQDVGIVFHMDDPGYTFPINDSTTQYQLKQFERQLTEWKKETVKYMPEPILAQYDAVVSLYIHEVAMHNDHNVDDFRPMYRSTGRETDFAAEDFLTKNHFEALAICVDSMERAMRAFIDIDDDLLQSLPTIHTVWTAYVAIAMIRLHGVLSLPSSKYGPIFLPKMNIIKHLDGCIHKLQHMVLGRPLIPAEGFILAFQKLKSWHIYRTSLIATYTGKSAVHDQAAKPVRIQHTDQDEPAREYLTSKSNPTAELPVNVRSSISSESHSARNQSSPNTQPQPQQFLQPSHFSQMDTDQPFSMQQQQQQIVTGAGAISGSLLNPNVAIDASSFDFPWDWTTGDMNNFENYLNDPGWMGYLM